MNYLLNADHPVGRTKRNAELFTQQIAFDATLMLCKRLKSKKPNTG